jgi:acyl-CoA thioesterase-1
VSRGLHASRRDGTLPVAAVLLLLALAFLAHAEERPAILVVGDSLSAGFGIPLEDSWVALLERRLAEHGYDYRVVNASISGDTSAGGRARLPQALEREQPALVIIELGGNDGLRGQPPPLIRQNLAAMIEASRAADAEVLLVGIRIPPNYGPTYTESVAAVYPSLAESYRVSLVPFLLAEVAGEPSLMQSDGVHPTAEAQPRLLENVWEALQPLLQR